MSSKISSKFLDEEEYAKVEGALEAHNEYKKELDEYGY